jgi:hypothetical protein
VQDTLSPTALANRVQQLLDERQEHEDAVQRINQTLESIQSLLGTPEVYLKRGRRPAPTPIVGAAPAQTPSKRGRRGEFAITGEESILAFVHEREKPTTKDINAHWKEEGRGGSADSLLGKLVKDKRLTRNPLGGKLGSEYTLASSAVSPAAKPSAGGGRKRGRRGEYATTAIESITAFVKEKGSPTTQEIRALWKREGRGGTADNVLSRLVKDKKLERTQMEGERGSRYSLP